MLFSKARLIRSGLATILVVLAGNAALAFWSIRRIAENKRWVVHTHEVLEALADSLSMLKDAETG